MVILPILHTYYLTILIHQFEPFRKLKLKFFKCKQLCLEIKSNEQWNCIRIVTGNYIIFRSSKKSTHMYSDYYEEEKADTAHTLGSQRSVSLVSRRGIKLLFIIKKLGFHTPI